MLILAIALGAVGSSAVIGSSFALILNYRTLKNGN